MVQYVTKSKLREFASALPVREQATLLKSASAQVLEGSTFLSHSSKDEDLVVGVIRVLQGHGATVYVDEIDPQMPPYTNSETAELLKRRIQQTRRFVMLTSENSKESRWVPWELGIADGYNGISEIALFPASEYGYDQTWASWEYLGLYRKIVWGDLQGYNEPLWMVLDERRNSAVSLTNWIRGY